MLWGHVCERPHTSLKLGKYVERRYFISEWMVEFMLARGDGERMKSVVEKGVFSAQQPESAGMTPKRPKLATSPHARGYRPSLPVWQ